MSSKETKEMIRILKRDALPLYHPKGYAMRQFKKDEGITKIIKDGKVIAWIIDEDEAEDLFNGLRMWIRSGKIMRDMQGG